MIDVYCSNSLKYLRNLILKLFDLLSILFPIHLKLLDPLLVQAGLLF